MRDHWHLSLGHDDDNLLSWLAGVTGLVIGLAIVADFATDGDHQPFTLQDLYGHHNGDLEECRMVYF